MILLHLLVAVLLTTSYPPEAAVDSLLNVQRERFGVRAEEIFYDLENVELTAEERDDLRFLIAYLPLGDAANPQISSILTQSVRYAHKAQDRFIWGNDIPEDVYLHFVLPHRVSQEPAVSWREVFYREIAPRIEGMSMTEAALEVNHWCHEKATFKVSSPRDQDALTTIRAGYGRCEEEMILTICALRSVGIPARQCYTPYWPHTDNNHAWVEVWADGGWHYMGGCEPKPSLDDAWFIQAAGRAMLVVSTAYGDYQGDEPVLKRYPRSTLINSTAVYGPTHEIKLSLVNRKGRPVPDKRFVFSLFNYGALMPALALDGDDNGQCSLNCGKGSWIVGAGHKKLIALQHISADEDDVILRLDKKDYLTQLTGIDYIPPPKPEEVELVEIDSLFKARLAFENSLRDSSVWCVWASEAGIQLDNNFTSKPDSFFAEEMANVYGLDSAKTLELFTKAHGNWGHLYRFLTGDYPTDVALRGSGILFPAPPEAVLIRFILLETLSDKDLHDFTIDALEDHFRYTTLDWNLAELADSGTSVINGVDLKKLSDEEDEPSEQKRIRDYVIKPRINYEPSTGWRSTLVDFLRVNPKLVTSKNDKKMIKWLRKNIILEENPDRLGPSLAPDAVLELRRGRWGDIERLYVGLCRVRGIPAGFDTVSDRLEVWRDDGWQAVQVIKPQKGSKKPAKKGSLTLTYEAPDSVLQKSLYMRNWAVQRWMGDHGSVVDFGYKKPLNEVTFPQELPEGLYCLTTGHRRKDGSAPISLTWFKIEASKEQSFDLIFRDLEVKVEKNKEEKEQIVPGEDSRQDHD